jgi:hypothetical protein
MKNARSCVGLPGIVVCLLLCGCGRGQPGGEVHQPAPVKSAVQVSPIASNDFRPADNEVSQSTNQSFLSPGESVQKVYPDGLLLASSGEHGLSLRRVKFKDLPESVKSQYRKEAQPAAPDEAERPLTLGTQVPGGASPIAKPETEKERLDRVLAEQLRKLNAPREEAARELAVWSEQRKLKEIAEQQSAKEKELADQESATVSALSQIISDYHRNHTYVGGPTNGGDIFVCGDMASDVWDILQTKGIPAKIMVGNVMKDVASYAEYDHAWVLAQLPTGRWLALEATGGCIVDNKEKPRYYSGHAFSSPKPVKEYNRLVRQREEAIPKFNVAKHDYNEILNRWNVADERARSWLGPEMARKSSALQERIADLKELNEKLAALMSETH